MNYKENILNNLINANVWDSDMFLQKVLVKDNSERVEQLLQGVPEEQLERIALAMPEQNQHLDKWIEKISRFGLLKFQPYILEDKGRVPSLALKHNRFMHMFRGYHFQISYTHSGVGEYQCACPRWDVMKQRFDFCARDSKLLQILFYMNCINCGIGIDEFNKLFIENSEVLDDFVALSAKGQYLPEYNITCRMLKEYIEKVDVSLASIVINDYEYRRISKSETMDYARIAMDKKNYVVYMDFMTSAGLQSVKFDIGKILKQDDSIIKAARFALDDEEYTTLENAIEGTISDLMSDGEVMATVAEFLLNSVLMVVNTMVIYPSSTNIIPMKALNTTSYKVATKYEHLLYTK